MKEKIILNGRKSRIALILVLTILMQIFMPIFTETAKVYATPLSDSDVGIPVGAFVVNKIIKLNTNGGTINSGNITSYDEGTGATLPTDVTKNNYVFAGWYDNEGLTGNPVTEISATDTGDKEYWAKWTTATCTVTFNPNGGRVSNKYPLQDLTVNKGTDFKLPSLPSLPEIAYIDAGMYIVVASPEGKVFDAFEVDGERKNPEDIITINNDTVIKYLWKDVTYIHEINLTIEAPIVGVKVDAEWNDVLNSLDYSTQTNRPIVTVPDGVNYMVEDEVTYWYDGDYNVFTGTIEKDTTYNATIYVCGITNEYQIADDVKVFVNGKEVTTFDNQELWICIDYSIDSIENSNKYEYTIESDTNSGDTISFTASEGDIYSFYIKDRLSTTDEDIQHVVDLFDDPEFTFEALKEQLNKLIAYGKNAAGESGTLLKLYEMYLYNNGVEIHEIEGGFKLRLKITDDMKGYDSYKLIYISEEDGTTEDAITLTVNGEYLEGTLPHLSLYALAGSKTETTTTDSNLTTEDTTTTTETKTTSNPKTGDNIAVWFSLMVISILGIAGTAKLHRKILIFKTNKIILTCYQDFGIPYNEIVNKFF